jgi:hypothetical protein
VNGALFGGHYFFFNNRRKHKVDYHDYTFKINSKGIELDPEITIQHLITRHNYAQGDEFVLVVLGNKVTLVKAEKLPGPKWFK